MRLSPSSWFATHQAASSCAPALIMLRRLLHLRRICAFAIVVVSAVGCHQITDIDAPDLVDPSSLDNPFGASARYAGAIGAFAAAFSEQSTETGLISDELQDVGGNAYSSDRRDILPLNRYPFAGLSAARISALRAIETLEQFAPTSPEKAGELFALAGFVETMFAENLCSPVPLATVVDGMPTKAPTYDRTALIQHALAMFDSAIAYAGSSENVANLAQVGRARLLLTAGEPAAAAAAVADVPLNFVYAVPYSVNASAQTNTLYDEIAVGRYVSVSDLEGQNGLPFISGSDARIAAQSLGLSRTGLPLYTFAGASGLDAPIVLASGVEAVLIRAEAELDAGEYENWAASLNQLRGTALDTPLPALPSDSTTDVSLETRISVLFHERAFWLFGTGHRQGDMLRLIRDYGRTPEETFPTGDYTPTPGVSYGASTVFTPSGEEPNDLYQGCTGTAG